MVDAFSRYGLAAAVENAKTDAILDFVHEKLLHHHGPPMHFASNNGSQFKSDKFQELVKRLQIKHSTTCEFNPQANGMYEWFNGSLVTIKRRPRPKMPGQLGSVAPLGPVGLPPLRK